MRGGWRLAGLVTALVGSAALLALPRSTKPVLFPVPLIDARDVSALSARYAELEGRARERELPFETRAVGDAVRKLGLTAAERGDVARALSVLRERVRLAIAAGQRARLAELRALQASMFIRATRAQKRDELRALAGEFFERAQASGWFEGGSFRGAEAELRSLFVVRWNELTGLSRAPELAATLVELRLYYRFLLLYPEQTTAQRPDASALAEKRLAYAQALGKNDPEYPLELTRGVLLARIGRNEAAAGALRRHLAGSREWALRARNHLLSVAQSAAGAEP